MLKLAEYVAGFLADRGVRYVFLVTGGGAMHLNDAFGYEPRSNTSAATMNRLVQWRPRVTRASADAWA